MGFSNIALALGVSVALVLSVVAGLDVTGLRPCDFPAVYNFGDSNSDTGGISAAFEPIGEPYGVSYFKRPAGRGSDGRLIIDFIGMSDLVYNSYDSREMLCISFDAQIRVRTSAKSHHPDTCL